MAAHTVHALALGVTVYDGITQSSLSPGVEEMVLGADGEAFNRFAAVSQIQPRLTYTTRKAQAHLAGIGVTGLEISATALDAYFKALDHGGTRLTTGVKLSVSKGLWVPRTLRASVGGEATLDAEIIMGGTDGSAPYTVADGETVVTGADLDEIHGLGTVEVNDTAVGMVTDVQVDFGVNVRTIIADGDIYPSLVYVESYQPSITFTTLDAAKLATFTISGASNTCDVAFLKRLEGGLLAGSDPITISTTQSRVTTQSLGGSHGGEVAHQVTVTPTYDGTNHPITIG